MYFIIPPANEVWGKVMFLLASVILFTGGGVSLWTETLLVRDLLDRDPLNKDPPDRDPLNRDSPVLTSSGGH